MPLLGDTEGNMNTYACGSTSCSRGQFCVKTGSETCPAVRNMSNAYSHYYCDTPIAGWVPLLSVSNKSASDDDNGVSHNEVLTVDYKVKDGIIILQIAWDGGIANHEELPLGSAGTCYTRCWHLYCQVPILIGLLGSNL